MLQQPHHQTGWRRTLRWVLFDLLFLSNNYLFPQETAASFYNVDENNLEYDLLKANVFYNSLLEKTVTDKIDYDLKVRSM